MPLCSRRIASHPGAGEGIVHGWGTEGERSEFPTRCADRVGGFLGMNSVLLLTTKTPKNRLVRDQRPRESSQPSSDQYNLGTES